MNIIDVTNIKKELAKRNAANYDWEDGGDWDYSDEKYQVQTITFSNMFMNSDSGSGTFYIGVSTEAIQQFINTKGSDKLEGLLKEIEKKQAELDELMQKKQKAEAEANLEVNESKNN